MKLLDLTLPSPAENLALDEALLDWCETGVGKEVLRFWESHEYFIVVGYANKVCAEVNRAACKSMGIPIYRRCSGGGSVLQGPGCLNYTLVLKTMEAGPLQNISSTNRFIMDKNRGAIETLIPESRTRGSVSRVAVRGHTDLCLGNMKFSGNSQRRRNTYLLFHGTFLLNLDLVLIGNLLPVPSRQPDYRVDRAHDRFLTNLNLPAEKVKTALRKAWKDEGRVTEPPLDRVKVLVRDKYASAKWNHKF